VPGRCRTCIGEDHHYTQTGPQQTSARVGNRSQASRADGCIAEDISIRRFVRHSHVFKESDREREGAVLVDFDGATSYSDA
jgi:hypothetical protein